MEILFSSVELLCSQNYSKYILGTTITKLTMMYFQTPEHGKRKNTIGKI